MALEEHKSCLCVDPNSINVTLDVDVRLRRDLHMREEEKLSREIRSVAPTISNAIIQTTRATSSAAAHVKSGSSSKTSPYKNLNNRMRKDSLFRVYVNPHE